MDKFEELRKQLTQATKKISQEEPAAFMASMANIKDIPYGEKADFLTSVIITLKRAYKQYSDEMRQIEIGREDALKQLDTLRKEQQGLLKAIVIVQDMKQKERQNNG